MPMLTRIFNCLASWWDNAGIMTEQDVPVSPLLETVFYVLRNPISMPESTFDAASQWVLALLYQCKSFGRTSGGLLSCLQTNIYELATVVQDCASAVASLAGQPQQQEQLELYRDRCSCIAHIFSSLIRTLRPSLVDQPTLPGSGSLGDLRTFDCILVILELAPPLASRELAAITFHSLHSLADDAARAIDALYINSDTAYKEQASKWLCEFQKSLYAWEISDQLLYMKRDLNSCYFGAQTIRIKMTSSTLRLGLNRRHALMAQFEATKSQVIGLLHRSLASACNTNQPRSDASTMANGAGDPPRPASALVPYFTRVVVALTRYCPSNASDLESTEELRDFRDDVHDLMQDILSLVGSETIFVELYTHVQRLQMLAVSANAQVTATEVLREAEACLFMLTTVAKRLSPHDPEGHISNLISGLVLPGLASDCPHPLQEVGCLLYMELSHWAACHPQLRRQIVDQLIKIVEKAAGVELNQLQPGQKLAVGAALSALGSLCAVYRATAPPQNGTLNNDSLRTGLLDDHWQDLVQHVAYNLPRLAWVPVHDATVFFTGIGRGLLSSIGSGGGVEFDPQSARHLFPSRLAQISSVNLECLTKLMDDQVPISGTDTLTDPRVWLDYLAALFRTMTSLLRRLDDPTKPGTGTTEISGLVSSAQRCLSESLRLVREAVWPVVARVLTHYAVRVRPMEHACRLIRFIVRCFSVHLRDLLPEIAEKIVTSYNSGGQHSSFLYLASVLVDEFGELPDCRVGLVRMYEAIGGPTLKLLTGPNLVEQPHTIEDLYRLCTRLVQHCPAVFLTSEQVNLHELCGTAVRSLDLCCSGPSAGHSGEDASGSNSSEGDSGSSSANTSASAAAARFFIDLLIFAGEASEVTPTQVMQALSSGGQLSNPSCPSAMAAQRVLIWLTYPASVDNSQVPECGGQLLVSASLQACCLGLSEDRFPELADILYHLKVITKSELFLNWLTTGVASLPIHRADGLVHATDEQINDFKEVVMSCSRSSVIVHALESFARLFR
ncbi:Transportin-3 [Fasciola hepatica]|uniref:Transportin-3 n=1 Tax=Fasciola hepatica TaxID=6192 RepID=A0A4E0RII5_FASHE|nr:Transportin-3 [Fasciola hepatica]